MGNLFFDTTYFGSFLFAVIYIVVYYLPHFCLDLNNFPYVNKDPHPKTKMPCSIIFSMSGIYNWLRLTDLGLLDFA
jgi:hypothetical protein